MNLNVHARAVYELPADTFLLLMVEPTLFGMRHRVLTESLMTSPTPFSDLWTDSFGNPQRRMSVPKGQFSFDFRASITVNPDKPIPDWAAEPPPREIPPEAMVYTLPSRYCQSDRLVRLAQSEFGQVPPGKRRITAIVEWIRRHVEYRYGTTNASTSAADTAIERVGVCRDFAHLLIAFCRAIGIPARYVSGYALGLEPPDFHGYAQVYLGADWHNVDATYQGVRAALVPIAIGRDAADVAITTLWGTGTVLDQSVEVTQAR